MSACAGCGAKFAPFGLWPPLRAQPVSFCATCIEFQPETQAALAWRAREALDDREVMVR